VTDAANQKSISKQNHFSPDERQSILDQLVASLQEDQKIGGVLVVGSGSEGFEDVYSDIDLCVVIVQPQDVYPVFHEWGTRLKQLLPVFYCGESVRGPNSYLWVLLLECFLELDIGFLCLDDLEARRGRWKTAFDRSGRIEAIMQTSWASRTGPDVQEAYRRRVDWVWHNVIHATVAAQRGQKWRALCELEQVRNQAIELRGLREGLETRRFRHVDKMSGEFLSDVERSLVMDLTTAEIMRALREAVKCFFTEARHFDQVLRSDRAQRLEEKLNEYLALFE
jgi:hypothetical protein